MNLTDRPVANPLIVLREEFDDWALLFEPDSGNAFGINPTGLFIWRRLDGRRSLEDIVEELRESSDGVPADAAGHVTEFVRALAEQGLTGFEVDGSPPVEGAGGRAAPPERASP